MGVTAAGVDLSAAAEVGTVILIEGAALSVGATTTGSDGAGVDPLEMMGAASLEEGTPLGSTALLDSTGLEAWAVVGLLAGVELGLGTAVVVGFG